MGQIWDFLKLSLSIFCLAKFDIHGPVTLVQDVRLGPEVGQIVTK